MTGKVFCIGFHKTGTSSLAYALEELGYRVTGPNGVNDPDIAKNVTKMVRKLVRRYDAFQDNPWPVLYRELDVEYPGSKFILTKRDPDAWIKSQVGHFGAKETPMRKWIYGVGSPLGHEDIYIKRYVDHNRDVEEYFSERPDDLLLMELSSGDGWEKLCAFLDKQIPSVPFPHANKSGERKSTGRKRSWYNRLLRR